MGDSMRNEFNTARDYIQKMYDEGRVTLTHRSDEDREKQHRMNEEMRKVREEYLYKAARSEQSAEKIVIR